MLEEMGFVVIGPVASAQEACRLATRERFDLGILDVNLRDGTSEPIARELQSRACPFFFLTGYSSPQMLPADLLVVTRLTKPVDPVALEETLRALGLPVAQP